MSMFDDVDWTKVFPNSEKGQELRQKVSAWTLTFRGSREEEKWYGTYTYTSEGKWDSNADVMLANFKASGHPLNRGVLKRKGG